MDGSVKAAVVRFPVPALRRSVGWRLLGPQEDITKGSPIMIQSMHEFD